jgi:hypothetical protein
MRNQAGSDMPFMPKARLGALMGRETTNVVEFSSAVIAAGCRF